MIILVIINTLIFLMVSLLHVYWAFGGRWGADAAHPTNSSGERIINPGMGITLMVASGLMLFALITLGNLGIFDSIISKNYIVYGTCLIAFIFLLRSIGEFHYLGFFKRIKDTDFGRLDSKIYSPLCLFIGLISLMIVLMN